MKKFLVTIVIICLFTLCGCSGYQEINRGYLVTAIGISNQNNNVTIFVEAICSSDVLDNPQERVCLTASGESIDSCFENLRLKLAKPLYFQQLGTVIFENSYNDESIDFLKDMPNFNYGIYLTQTDNLNSLFNLETPGGVLGYDIISLIKNLPKEIKKKASYQFYKAQNNYSPLPLVSVKDENLYINVSGE